ncbi:hypothetical protein ACN2WE_18075 [Streptomyces sp. cg28]|uniref:hypothetical protein n=1 Tax=Streptomyces sp. cg28 TaxID=3403457 RepID=UPI003B223B38
MSRPASYAALVRSRVEHRQARRHPEREVHEHGDPASTVHSVDGTSATARPPSPRAAR